MFIRLLRIRWRRMRNKTQKHLNFMRMIGCFAPEWGIRGCKKFKDIEREEKVISEGHIGWEKILSDMPF